jgi:hypothetical protein
VPVVGYLYFGSAATPLLLAAFRKGLGDTGHIEGKNVAIEYRWANNALDQLPELAADLVRRRVDVIVAPASTQAALAAKAATTTIPIVFSTGVDPVIMAYGFGKAVQPIAGVMQETQHRVLEVRWLPPRADDHSKCVDLSKEENKGG